MMTYILQESERIIVGAFGKSMNVLGISAAVYIGACVVHSYTVSSNLELLRGEFKRTTNESASILETRVRDSRVVLDYDGKLDDVIKKRNDYLKAEGCMMLSGRWYVTKNASAQKVTIDDRIVCYKPFSF